MSDAAHPPASGPGPIPPVAVPPGTTTPGMGGPGSPPPSSAAHEPSFPRIYRDIFIALLVLLVVTVGVAFIHLGALNLTVALLIATVKTVLVLVWFMHLKDAGRLSVVFAISGFLFLAILTGILLADYLTR